MQPTQQCDCASRGPTRTRLPWTVGPSSNTHTHPHPAPPSPLSLLSLSPAALLLRSSARRVLIGVVLSGCRSVDAASPLLRCLAATRSVAPPAALTPLTSHPHLSNTPRAGNTPRRMEKRGRANAAARLALIVALAAVAASLAPLARAECDPEWDGLLLHCTSHAARCISHVAMQPESLPLSTRTWLLFACARLRLAARPHSPLVACCRSVAHWPPRLTSHLCSSLLCLCQGALPRFPPAM